MNEILSAFVIPIHRGDFTTELFALLTITPNTFRLFTFVLCLIAAIINLFIGLHVERKDQWSWVSLALGALLLAYIVSVV